MNKKNRTYCLEDFVIPVDPRVKVKENKYLNLAGELRKLWNMKVTVIPVITGSLRMVPKSFVRGLEELEIGGRAETIETTVLVIWQEY